MVSRKKLKNNLTYATLFSSAGVGCYGFKIEGYNCLATNEFIKSRLDIQRYNNIAISETGYILGDISTHPIQTKFFAAINGRKLDVLIATPPCQGMSVANHKKGDESKRNSLVVESIKICKSLEPKYFIFENVRSFLKTLCTDIDGDNIQINESITRHLLPLYNIESKIINLAEFGSNSSRTRTIVIGTRKDLVDVSPLDLFPKKQTGKTLKESIYKFPKLSHIGEISPDDIFHNFRPYPSRMRAWISDLEEGQSAFENKEDNKKPHQIIDNKIVVNKSSNGDKYRRNIWNKIGPCVHTRNDQLASQNTIHPDQDRVFSIRELMKLMTIPDSFKWTIEPNKKLNSLTLDQKKKFLKKNELNIRRCIGEAVPTKIFNEIAKTINNIEKNRISKKQLLQEIKNKKLNDKKNKEKYISNNPYSFEMTRLIELSNSLRENNKAYYTSPGACHGLVSSLPNFQNKKNLKILEPSSGTGNFLPFIINKYKHIKNVEIDLVDIDQDSLITLKLIVKKMNPPKNFSFRFFNQNFLSFEPIDDKQLQLPIGNNNEYDLIIGNPPFGKINQASKENVNLNSFQKKSKNIFSYFLEKSIKTGKYVAFISPKSFISAPEFDDLRKIILSRDVIRIIDHGEKAFDGDVKIETIGITIGPQSNNPDVTVESLITKTIQVHKKDYIFDSSYPSWLLYRNKNFDKTAKKMELGTFKVFRDRQITKAITEPHGKYRVLKSRNIGNNMIKDIKGYDCYIDEIESLKVSEFVNKKVIIVPNLSYYPRGCMLPKNAIVDGSAAILIPSKSFTKSHIDFFSSNEFHQYYRIARNYGTRSLNIDNNSVYFFGRLKK